MKEGLYTTKELKRITIIQSVIDKKRTQKEAAIALKLSERQIRKIIKMYKEEGLDSIKHGNKKINLYIHSPMILKIILFN